MKRDVKDGYHFKTRPLYPAWQIRVKKLVDLLNNDERLMARVDHIFRRDGQWHQLTCDGWMGDYSRLELARITGGLRSAILAMKKEIA